MKSSKFQFLNPYLEELYFTANPEYAPDSAEIGIEMQNAFNVQVARSKNENKANVKLTLETNTENEKAPFKLRISMASDFKWEDMDEKTIDSTLRLNAPALLLGYMRPIVANITNSSSFPVYNLPFFNFKE